MTCLALMIGVAVSVWIVIGPTSHADGLAPDDAASATHKPVQHRVPVKPTPTATPSKAAPKPTPKPVSNTWRYQNKCPEKALACVDLEHKVSWLQINGVVMYGPVRIEPGSPGQVTPKGIFTVSWKDKHHISNEFDEAMPDAIFFAPGGIAFHVGSLTKGSHGCVHMTVRDANYYWDQVQVGATVAVF